VFPCRQGYATATAGAGSAGDFDIIARPNVNEGLIIRWAGEDIWNRRTYLKAKIPSGSIVPLDSGAVFNIGLDYNGKGKVETKNLEEVSVTTTDAAEKDFSNAWARAAKVSMPQPVIPGTREITVRFEVLNGGWGLTKSYGIVSTQDDSYLLINNGVSSGDYDITIPVSPGDEYLNIRWKGKTVEGDTVLKAKMKAESGTITVDYQGYNDIMQPSVAVNNLYDVEIDKPGVYTDYKVSAMTPFGVYKGISAMTPLGGVYTTTPLGDDWEDAMMRADYIY